MGTAAPARCLGHPTAAPSLVALRTFRRADDVQHNGRRRAHGVQLPAPTTGIFAECRLALSVPNRLDRATSCKPAAGPTFLGHADVHSLRARNGTLPVRPLLPGLRNATLVRAVSLSQPVWHARGFHPNQEPNPLARRALRHRNRRADCWIQPSLRCFGIRALTLASELAARRQFRSVNTTGIPAGLPPRCTVAAYRNAALSALSPSDRRCCAGSDVRNRAQPSSLWPA